MGSLQALLSKSKNDNDNDNKNDKNEEEEESKSTLEQEADSLQMVLPNIYMGSAVAAKNLNLLKSVGITHILAIGWNLHCHYPEEFKYLLMNKIIDSPSFLIIKTFPECFEFMNDAMNNKNNKNNNNLFVHCHKGLSRSATLIIGFEMWKHKKSFDKVLDEIKKRRSFVYPNIGFQAQLHQFGKKNYSLDINDYKDFDVMDYISHQLPIIIKKIEKHYQCYKNDENVDDEELFELTLYLNQVHKLKTKEKLKLNEDIKYLSQGIQLLRNIQIEFVKNEASLKRFDIMFKDNT